MASLRAVQWLVNLKLEYPGGSMCTTGTVRNEADNERQLAAEGRRSMANFLNVGGESWEQLALRDDIVHMGHNCNTLDLHPAINQAMTEAIGSDAYRVYTPPEGFEELRALMARDVDLPGTQIMVTQGATEAIYQTMATVLSPGDETIVSDPGWPHIANFARSLGSKVIPIPIYSDNKQHKLLPDLVADKITPRTRLITIVDPLNPLGSHYSEQEIQTFCALAERNDAFLLHDATYRDFAVGGHFPAVRYSERAVMCISLSKICGFAGLRVGATIAAPELIRRIADHQVSRLGGNWVAQRGAIAAYRTKHEWCPRVLETSRRHQAMLHECVTELDGLTAIAFPAAGNFLAIDVAGAGLEAEDVVRATLARGIIIRSGGYTSEQFGNRFIRVTTTVPKAHIDRFCTVFPQAIEAARAAG